MKKVIWFTIGLFLLVCFNAYGARNGVHLLDPNSREYEGDSTTGFPVDVKSINMDPNGTGACGSAFYAIKRVNIDPNTSVNLAFGFTSEKVVVETAAGNTQNLVVDWLGGTAVAPSANTAGDDVIEPGRIITFDDYHVTSISVISAGTGSQTVTVRAHK